jgi:hypothetical protein
VGLGRPNFSVGVYAPWELGQPPARRNPVRLLTKIHDASHDGVNTEGVI